LDAWDTWIPGYLDTWIHGYLGGVSRSPCRSVVDTYCSCCGPPFRLLLLLLAICGGFPPLFIFSRYHPALFIIIFCRLFAASGLNLFASQQAFKFLLTSCQFCRSIKFWYGSGSADPYL
jgi:hypothetical protein